MIVILIEPTQLLGFLGTLQLSAHVTVLRGLRMTIKTGCPVSENSLR
jgi:hypothetical protein